MVRVELGDWEKLRPWAAPIRHAVFVVEQQVPLEMEIDAQDPLSVHAIARDESGLALGTGRLLPDGHIGRMAVIREGRSKGVGGALLHALMDEARRRGHRRIVLSAQVRAVDFYLRHGYRIDGPEYLDAGIVHVDMSCWL